MDNNTTTPKVSQLEYARMIEQAQGPQAPVTWLSVGELIEMLTPPEVEYTKAEFAILLLAMANQVQA